MYCSHTATAATAIESHLLQGMCHSTPHLPHGSSAYCSSWALGAAVCQSHILVPQTPLRADVDLHELLVWSQAFCFCYTINTAPSLKLLIDTLLLPTHRDPVAMVPQDWALYVLQKHIDGVDVAVGQFKALDVGLDGS